MGGELAVAVRTQTGTLIMLDSLSSLAKPSAPRRTRASGVARKRQTRPAGKAKVERGGAAVA